MLNNSFQSFDMHISTHTDIGIGPPPPVNMATHPKRQLKLREQAKHSESVSSNLSATDLTETQRLALARSDISPPQYCEVTRELAHLTLCDLATDKRDVIYDSDSSDEVELVWTSMNSALDAHSNAYQHNGPYSESINQPSVPATAPKSLAKVSSPAYRVLQQESSEVTAATHNLPVTPLRPSSASLQQGFSRKMDVQHDLPTNPQSRLISSSQELSYIPAIAVEHLPKRTMQKPRYYVVTVGKCAGIYYDTWYVRLTLTLALDIVNNLVLQESC
jgi:hypothetical protein